MLFLIFSVISLTSTSKVLGAATCDSFRQPHEPICRGPANVYYVEGSLGKGLGVFSHHDLDIGDVVMRETPILKISRPDYVKGTGYPIAAVSKAVRKEFKTLSPLEQAEVLSLTYYATAVEEKTMDKLGLIFRNNAYNTGEKIGLFPRIARINHSCKPNTSYYWSEKLNKRIVYATRKIRAGEEFFVSYIPLLHTHEERQKRLNRYGFQCSCEACTQKGAMMDASNNRRTTIDRALKAFEPQLTLHPPKSKAETQQALNNAKASTRLIELIHEEGLA